MSECQKQDLLKHRQLKNINAKEILLIHLEDTQYGTLLVLRYLLIISTL